MVLLALVRRDQRRLLLGEPRLLVCERGTSALERGLALGEARLAVGERRLARLRRLLRRAELVAHRRGRRGARRLSRGERLIRSPELLHLLAEGGLAIGEDPALRRELTLRVHECTLALLHRILRRLSGRLGGGNSWLGCRHFWRWRGGGARGRGTRLVLRRVLRPTLGRRLVGLLERAECCPHRLRALPLAQLGNPPVAIPNKRSSCERARVDRDARTGDARAQLDVCGYDPEGRFGQKMHSGQGEVRARTH